MKQKGGGLFRSAAASTAVRANLASKLLYAAGVVAALGVAMLLAALLAGPARAETFTVNSTANPGTGACDAAECTLKEAINAANTNGEGDTIVFATDLGGEIQLSSAPEQGGFFIRNDTPGEDLTIDGPGAEALAINGNNEAWIFVIEDTFGVGERPRVTIEGLTIKNGRSLGLAGGISNGGELTLTDSTLSGNYARNFGGGIYNMEGAGLTVTGSTFSGNFADAGGGGILNDSDNRLTVTGSTFSGNATGGAGGGIQSGRDALLTVANSTLSGNFARWGGGIYDTGDGKLSNTTVSGNSATESHGGIYAVGGQPVLSNSIVAGNNAPTNPDATGWFSSQGYNLIGDTTGSSGWVGSDLLNQAPRLGPLQNNGGPTETQAPLGGSPAINAIPEGTNGCGTTMATDQRGVARPKGDACEVGSVEVEDVEDVTKPTVDIASPNRGVYGLDEEVRADYSCEDEPGGSGIASCVGDVPDGSLIDTSFGQHTFDVTATDNAGNRNTVTYTYHVVIRDTFAPVIRIFTPQDGAVYELDAEVRASYTCSDGLGGTGLASCEGNVPSSARIDTSSPGQHTFTVTAADNVGNESTLTHTYTVEAPASGGCTITGTEAADALVGTAGKDVICGLGGNDTLRGLADNDTLRGGEGDDRLFGAGGDDSLEGEAGRDTASYTGSEAAIVASLAAGTATGEGSDTLMGIEHLVGSRFGDDFTGSEAANRISGVNGADTLRGGASNDTLIGKSGPDDLRGESGNDNLDSRDGKTGNDRLDGGTGTDACLKDATERSVTSCER